jgi:hypothetical protein
MDFFNASAVGRTVVLFIMPSSGTKVTGSVPMSPVQALELAQRLREAAELALCTPLSGAEAVRVCTGASEGQLPLPSVL